MGRPQLIINADDFGVSKEVNEAVLQGFRKGVLTSCSLVAAGDAFDDAARIARENPGLSVGIHLVTIKGRSVLPHESIPSLVDREGRFPSNPAAAGLRYFLSKKAHRELRLELEAQFEKCRSTGLAISHIDGHLHMHIHPVIFRLALDLGEQYGVKRMRVPQDDFRTAFLFDRRRATRQAACAIVFRLLTRLMKRRLEKSGFFFAERAYGHIMSGRISEAYVLFALGRLKARKNELYLHPAAYDPHTPLTPGQRQELNEFEILCGTRVSEQIEALHIELTSYPGLPTRDVWHSRRENRAPESRWP